MVVNKKPTGRAMTIPAGLCVGGLVSLSITILLAVVIAKLVDSGSIPRSNIGYCVIGLLLIASFCGAMTAFGKIKRQRLLVCMLSGGVYVLILLSITALFFGGQYSAVGVTMLVIMAGSACAWLLGLRQGREKRKFKHRSR